MARSRRIDRARLLRDLHRLQLDLVAPSGMANLSLDAFTDREFSPPLPALHAVFQPLVDPAGAAFLQNTANRCQHAHGGPEPTADELGVLSPRQVHVDSLADRWQCVWCAYKREADKVDFVRKWNAQVALFLEGIAAVTTARIDHEMDLERGFIDQLNTLYWAKRQILTRAAQSWMLAHPPPPEYAGVMAEPGYNNFCPSRLVHLACNDDYCLDCKGLVWLAYTDELLEYFSQQAVFEGQVHALSWYGAAEISFWTDPDRDAESRRFKYNGVRKRAAIRRYLEWADVTPLPSMWRTARRLTRGPGNNSEGTFHPWCKFFNCRNEDCDGMH